MLKSRPAALLRGAILAAALIGTASADAATPQLTGVSPNIAVPGQSTAFTISGTGFTGATGVEFVTTISGSARPATSFEVVSDSTIKATFDAAAIPGAGQQSVVPRITGGSATSSYNGAAIIQRWVPSEHPWASSHAVTCTLDGGTAGQATFTAQMTTDFDALPADFHPTAGDPVSLETLSASLDIPDGRVLKTSLGARPGLGTISSVELGIAGAGATSKTVDGRGSSFVSPSTIDANPLSARIAGQLFPGSITPSTPAGPATVTFRHYAASVQLKDSTGTTTTGRFDCDPEATAPSILTFDAVPPPITVAGISPAGGSAAGGTVVTVTGTGFAQGSTQVQIDAKPVAVTVNSGTSLSFVAPPHEPGSATVSVLSSAYRVIRSFTYESSKPTASVKTTLAATCTLPGGNVLHPTLTVTAPVPLGAEPGEPLVLSRLQSTLAFSGDETAPGINALLHAGAYLKSTVAITGSSLSSAPFHTDQTSGTPDGFSYGLNSKLSLGTAGSVPGGEVTAALGTVDIVYPLAGFPDQPPLPVLLAHCAPEPTPFARIPIGTTPSTPLDLGLKGTLALKSPAKGNVAVSGSLRGALTGDTFLGGLSLSPAVAKLTAYGIVPVTAALQFAPAGETTGTLTGGTLTTQSQVLVKVPGLRVLGLSIVNSGCQAKAASDVTLTATGFTTATGGTLTGTLAINGLTGCGINTNIASNVLTSSANTLSLKATPVAPATPAAS